MTEKKGVVAQKLETPVSKVKLFSSEGREEVDCKVFSPQAHGNPYIIEISKERFTRRVSVDIKSAQNLNLGRPDPALMREVRTAHRGRHALRATPHDATGLVTNPPI